MTGFLLVILFKYIKNIVSIKQLASLMFQTISAGRIVMSRTFCVCAIPKALKRRHAEAVFHPVEP
jgi:hypothetical protein